MLSAFIKDHKLPENFECTAWQYYKPLADAIFNQFSKVKQPYFVGINGCQGSGKSTLTDFISQYLMTQHQLNIVVMSLDDFYYSSEIRKQLAHDIHPLLATRGVPGTHDTATLKFVLSQLKKQTTALSIPRFNKAIDEPFPKNEWQSIKEPIDIILVEGWCWGVSPQTKEELQKPINDLEFQHDEKGIWRNYVNNQLESNYCPLYENINYWVSLQAPSFDCVYKWRLEQEQKLADKNIGLANSKVMTPEEVLNFTHYFQRLTIQGNKSLSESANAILNLNTNREISNMRIME